MKEPRFYVRPKDRAVDTLVPIPDSRAIGRHFHKPGKGHRVNAWRRALREIVLFFKGVL